MRERGRQMNLLMKTPLGGAISKSRYLDRRPTSSPLMKVEKTSYSFQQKSLVAGFAMCHKAEELIKDNESKVIMERVEKLVKREFPVWNVFQILEKEINGKISSLTDSLYGALKLIDRQIKIVRKGETGYLLKSSELLAQNIASMLNGGIESEKTVEEIKDSMKAKAKARRITLFEFNGQSHKVKGEHLTLDECINKFCEERYVNDFYTFKNREFFIKKYKVEHTCK